MGQNVDRSHTSVDFVVSAAKAKLFHLSEKKRKMKQKDKKQGKARKTEMDMKVQNLLSLFTTARRQTVSGDFS